MRRLYQVEIEIINGEGVSDKEGLTFDEAIQFRIETSLADIVDRITFRKPFNLPKRRINHGPIEQ